MSILNVEHLSHGFGDRAIFQDVSFRLLKGEHIGLDRDVTELSGGQRTKVLLGKLLLEKPDILVLDEPTNHLDVDAKDELKRALQEYRGSILMVCHEPEFYEGLATKVWDCSKWTTRV